VRDVASGPERHLSALQGHLGLREVGAQMFTHRYFRWHRPSPQTFELVDGEARVVPEAILMDDKDFPLVYQPTPQLFDDVVGGAATYVGEPLPITPAEIKRVIRDAADVLRRYDEELYAGFTEAVGTLAITGEWNLSNRSSYSTGSIYTGGIFTSLCADSPPLLVESFIHEYYHQRLWLWWLIEAPIDIPDRDLTMVSPITKQERSVKIMMQALLIYVSLTDYYRWADRVFADQSDWIGRRWRTLRSGTGELLNALRDALAGRDESLRFVNAVAEYAQ
jgi:HEXXH motif-containing protein